MSATPSAGASGTEAKVCQDIAERQALGIAKYGTTVAENPLSPQQWTQHAYEELLDGAVYLKRLMETQADTAALVALLKSMEWCGITMGGFGYTSSACPCCRSSISRGHLTDCKLREALATHREGAES